MTGARTAARPTRKLLSHDVSSVYNVRRDKNETRSDTRLPRISTTSICTQVLHEDNLHGIWRFEQNASLLRRTKKFTYILPWGVQRRRCRMVNAQRVWTKHELMIESWIKYWIMYHALIDELCIINESCNNERIIQSSSKRQIFINYRIMILTKREFMISVRIELDTQLLYDHSRSLNLTSVCQFCLL